MIQWNSTKEQPPEAGKEIVAKNPLRPSGIGTASKQCRIMKFHYSFDGEFIKNAMLEENLTLWAYTAGEE